MFYIIFLQTYVKLRTDKTFKLRTDNKHSTAKSNLQGNLRQHLIGHAETCDAYMGMVPVPRFFRAAIEAVSN